MICTFFFLIKKIQYTKIYSRSYYSRNPLAGLVLGFTHAFVHVPSYKGRQLHVPITYIKKTRVWGWQSTKNSPIVLIWEGWITLLYFYNDYGLFLFFSFLMDAISINGRHSFANINRVLATSIMTYNCNDFLVKTREMVITKNLWKPETSARCLFRLHSIRT